MKRFTWKTCLFGCLGIIALFVLVIILTGVWLTRKGEFDEETTILSAEANMFTRVYLERDDEVLVTFFVNQANKINSATTHGMPEFFRKFQKGQTKRDILKMLPVEAEILLQPKEEHFSVAVGFSLYNNMARLSFWFAKKAVPDEFLRSYNGHEYIAAEEGEFGDVKVDLDGHEKTFFAMAANTIMVTDQESRMQAMLASLSGPAGDHGQDERFRGVDVTAPVYGFARGETANRKFLKMLDEEREDTGSAMDLSFLERIDRLAYDFRVETKETVIGNLVLDTQDKSEEMKRSIDTVFAHFSEDSDVEISHSIEENAYGYIIHLKMTGFAEAVY